MLQASGGARSRELELIGDETQCYRDYGAWPHPRDTDDAHTVSTRPPIHTSAGLWPEAMMVLIRGARPRARLQDLGPPLAGMRRVSASRARIRALCGHVQRKRLIRPPGRGARSWQEGADVGEDGTRS